MIVIVTPTVMDGPVVRWYHDIPLNDVPLAESVVSASRNGVLVRTYLHDVPDDVLILAKGVHRQLRRGRDADVSHLATHRRRGLFGPLEPVTSAEKTPVTHRHACPDCGHDWECDSPVGTPCANQAANGNPARLCDLCWGMAKPARSDPQGS